MGLPTWYIADRNASLCQGDTVKTVITDAHANDAVSHQRVRFVTLSSFGEVGSTGRTSHQSAKLEGFRSPGMSLPQTAHA